MSSKRTRAEALLPEIVSVRSSKRVCVTRSAVSSRIDSIFEMINQCRESLKNSEEPSTLEVHYQRFLLTQFEDEQPTTEVVCDTGRIDLLTTKRIIEIKSADNYKHAIGQIICYGMLYPELQKTIALFGDVTSLKKECIENTCRHLGIAVIWIPVLQMKEIVQQSQPFCKPCDGEVTYWIIDDDEDDILFLGSSIVHIIDPSRNNHNNNKAYRCVDDEFKIKFVELKNKPVLETNYTGGAQAGQTLLTEAGLYQLLLGSRKPIAKKLKKWVFKTLLPSIGKIGFRKFEDLLNREVEKSKMLEMQNKTLKSENTRLDDLVNRIEAKLDKAEFDREAMQREIRESRRAAVRMEARLIETQTIAEQQRDLAEQRHQEIIDNQLVIERTTSAIHHCVRKNPKTPVSNDTQSKYAIWKLAASVEDLDEEDADCLYQKISGQRLNHRRKEANITSDYPAATKIGEAPSVASINMHHALKQKIVDRGFEYTRHPSKPARFAVNCTDAQLLEILRAVEQDCKEVEGHVYEE